MPLTRDWIESRPNLWKFITIRPLRSLLFLFLSVVGLGMENIGGVFVVLLSGLLLAVFMAGLEFVWVQQHSPRSEVRGHLQLISQLSCQLPS